MPLRLTVALTPVEVQRIAEGREVVMQASSGLSVIFEVAIVLRDAPGGPATPTRPAPVRTPSPPPSLPISAIMPRES